MPDFNLDIPCKHDNFGMIFFFNRICAQNSRDPLKYTLFVYSFCLTWKPAKWRVNMQKTLEGNEKGNLVASKRSTKYLPGWAVPPETTRMVDNN